MENVESGRADTQPTEDLTQAREQALAAHKNRVEQNADEPTLVADEDNVDTDKSFADVEGSNVQPTKDERASAPVPVESPQFVAPTDVPERHRSSAYDRHARGKSVDDADFEADEKGQDANG